MGSIRQSTYINMNTFVVLVALVGCALAQVQDTPEVAAAKLAHVAAYNAAAHAAAVAPDIDVQYADNEHNIVVPHHAYAYGYPAYGYAGLPYGYYGYPYAYHGYPYGVIPADTPEEHAAVGADATAVEEGDRKKRSVHYAHRRFYGYPRYGYHHGHHTVRNY